MDEIRLHLVESRQRSRAVLNVRQEKVPAGNAPGVIENWDVAVFKPPIFAIVNPLDDKQLTTDIGNVRPLLGAFINKLTRVLPFRDHNTATFAETAAIIS